MNDLDAERLINESFKVPEGQSFYEDFPVWRQDSGVGSWAETILQNNVMAAVAHGRLTQLRINGEVLPCGIIGGVATSEKFRGQGLGRRVVEAARDRLIRDGARLIVLWGTERAWYARMGFQPSGRQQLIPLHDVEVLSQASSAGLELRGGFSEEIFELMREARQKFGGLELTQKDRAWVSRHRNVRWFSACDSKTGQARAYTAVGRGIDFGGVIHEWGGEREALHAILATFQKEAPHLLLMGSPQALSAFQLVNTESHVITDSAALAYWPSERDALLLGPSLWLWGLDSA